MFIIKSSEAISLILVFMDDNDDPETGLTPTITVYNVTDATALVDGQAMTEISDTKAPGMYKYDIDAGDLASEKTYTIYGDGGDTIDVYRYQFGAFDTEKERYWYQR